MMFKRRTSDLCKVVIFSFFALLVGEKRIATLNAQITPWGKKDKAIELAQKSNLGVKQKTRKTFYNNYTETEYILPVMAKGIIDNSVSAEKGDIEVHGWKAKNVENQKYLVTYSFTRKQDNSNICWAFEVLIIDGVVRYIFSSEELKKTYSKDIAILAFGDANAEMLFWREATK